jgi:hypothetical protein
MQRQWRLFVSAFTLALGAASVVTPISQVKADDGENGDVVGSWFGTINPGTPLAFTDLLSLNLGGIASGTNGNAHNSQNPKAPPFARVDASDFFGSWEPIGHSQFAGTVNWLIFLGPNFDPSVDTDVNAVYCPKGTACFGGENIGVVTLQTVATLQHANSGDSLTGPYTIQYTDLSGDVVFKGSGTLSFSRIAIEPLQ